MSRRRERSVLCAEPGCPSILDAPGRCAEHRKDGWSRFRASAHGQARASGYGSRWRKVRAVKLKDHPRCEYCRRPATSVHHVGRELPTDPRFYDVGRLRSVCEDCHRKLSHLKS